MLGRKGLREAQGGPCEHPRSQVWMPGRAPRVAFQELHAAGASSGPHTAQPLTSGGRTSPPVQEGPRLRPTVLEQEHPRRGVRGGSKVEASVNCGRSETPGGPSFQR